MQQYASPLDKMYFAHTRQLTTLRATLLPVIKTCIMMITAENQQAATYNHWAKNE
jgi:hypothetical protein